MKVTVSKMNLENSLNEIIRLSEKYYSDVLPFGSYSIEKFFNFVSNDIAYDKDEQKTGDILRRPIITLQQGKGDCDCKTILILAFLKMKNIERGFSLVSDRSDKTVHHIFPFAIINGEVIDLDATYSNAQLNGKSKKYTYRRNYLI